MGKNPAKTWATQAAPQEPLDAPYFATAEREFGGAETRTQGETTTRQAIVLSTNLLHLFVRLKAYPGLALVVVCRSDTNLVLILTRLRSMRGA